MTGSIKAIQVTGDNDDELQAWLPDSTDVRRHVDLRIISVPLLGSRDFGFPGEVRKGEWLILQADGRLRVVSDTSFKQTWRRRIPH